MAGNLRQYSVNTAQNAALGQGGSILVTGTSAVTCVGGAFVAIQFLEDTTFNTGTSGLVSEETQSWPDSTYTSTDISASNGGVSDSQTFPQGMTIFGRWTSFQLLTGAVIAYRG